MSLADYVETFALSAANSARATAAKASSTAVVLLAFIRIYYDFANSRAT